MKKTRVRGVKSRNGEIHLVFADQILDENGLSIIDFDSGEIRRIMKEEASKPLLLARS